MNAINDRERENKINSQLVADNISSLSVEGVTHHQNGVHFANEATTNGGVVESESLVGVLGITASVVHVIGRVSVSTLVMRHESGLWWRWLIASSVSRVSRVLESRRDGVDLDVDGTFEMCKLHSPEVDRVPDLEGNHRLVGRDSGADIQA